jgi:hypothetical protein
MKLKERIELRQYDWPEKTCECYGCNHRALWRINFKIADEQLLLDLVGEDDKTLLTCQQHASIYVAQFHEVGDLVVCYGKDLR